MALLATVDKLIEQVRAQLDEENEATVTDNGDILPALNRAQDFAVDIMARHYEDPFLRTTVLDLQPGVQEYDIPEDSYSQRLEKVEVTNDGTYYELQRISYRDISFYETETQVNIPYYYVLIGSKIRFVPSPSGTYDARLWYMRSPDELVKQQGRITRVSEANNFLTVDNIGSVLTTETDKLNSYFNVVDGQTGEIKGSFKIKTLEDNRISIKTNPNATGFDATVLNRPVSTSLADLNIEKNDYICEIQGTCVPFFSKPNSNFYIQYAVAEIRRKLGDSADLEERVLRKFEQQVERTWAGREQTRRVKKRSKNWDTPYRRYHYYRGQS